MEDFFLSFCKYVDLACRPALLVRSLQFKCGHEERLCYNKNKKYPTILATPVNCRLFGNEITTWIQVSPYNVIKLSDQNFIKSCYFSTELIFYFLYNLNTRLNQFIDVVNWQFLYKKSIGSISKSQTIVIFCFVKLQR